MAAHIPQNSPLSATVRPQRLHDGFFSPQLWQKFVVIGFLQVGHSGILTSPHLEQTAESSHGQKSLRHGVCWLDCSLVTNPLQSVGNIFI
jgi:hypothetical protein